MRRDRAGADGEVAVAPDGALAPADAGVGEFQRRLGMVVEAVRRGAGAGSARFGGFAGFEAGRRGVAARAWRSA